MTSVASTSCREPASQGPTRPREAYSRYWEGATLLMQVRGEWLNAASSLIAFCTPEPALQAHVAKFQHQLVRLMSLLYCSALQRVALLADEALEVIDTQGLDTESLCFLVQSEDRGAHRSEREVVTFQGREVSSRGPSTEGGAAVLAPGAAALQAASGLENQKKVVFRFHL